MVGGVGFSGEVRERMMESGERKKKIGKRNERRVFLSFFGELTRKIRLFSKEIADSLGKMECPFRSSH